MNPPTFARRASSALAASLLAILLAHAADPTTATRASAIEMYDTGRYAEAARALLEIDQAGQADGALLYRLFYCQRVAGDAAATGTLERARAALEQESARAPSLETSFYLANAYANLRRPADAQRTASEALRSIESGAQAEPTTSFGRFALGKLHADTDHPQEAARWYARALDASSGDGAALAPAYVRWASRYLGDRSFEASEWDTAERAYTRLVDAGESSVEVFDRLAVTRARLGLWREAGEAWRKAERLDPANADRARYCARIVDQAASLGSLSATGPDGRLWTGWSKAELETLLAQQAQVVRSARQAVTATPAPDAAQRATLQASLDAARAVFVAAALEYALAGHDIRETAFIGGYAPLVFHADEWVLPVVWRAPDPPKP